MDALAMMRAFHPMVVWFAGAVAVTASVFDVLYVYAGTGLALAALYTIPLLAGLIACLIAGAEDLGLEPPVLSWTVAAAVAVGLTNTALVATVAAMHRTGPSDWRQGGEAVLLSAVSVPCFAVTAWAMANLARKLGIDLKTRLPEKKRVLPPVSVLAARPKAPVRPRPAQVVAIAPQLDEEALVLEYYQPITPRVVDLSEPRSVVPVVAGHVEPRSPRIQRGLAVPPSRQVRRPGRPPGSGYFGARGNQ
ncbi:MAG TPA: hypothetical protein VFT31_04195 [Kribbella sp.]|nr:hypothetical protein [Kribbella sp.]